MELKFDANQEFQTLAVESVTNLFEGQKRISTELEFSLGNSFATIANKLDLEEEALIANLRTVQQNNGILPDSALDYIESCVELADGFKVVRFPNFSIEMETGTGKTYVYIRTALDLFRHYNLCKFIIVVPSVAVREGVIKTLKVTERHLHELYDNIPYRYYVYDSDNLSRIRQFTLSNNIEIMVMTIDSFNKSKNIIKQNTDRLQGETPIHLVQATRPILILDEPQNMESELSVKALAALHPLFALRYSATHRNPYNLVYRLTPFEAYRQRLVKRIEVASVLKENDNNHAFVRLDDINTNKRVLTARIAVHRLMKGSSIKEQSVTVRPGDSLEQKTSRPEYGDYIVDEINFGSGFVRFTNNLELRLGEAQGADKESIFEAQIRYTIEEHFRKQSKLKALGVKVLSLFFIDRVDNYILEEGLIRLLFVQAFNDIKKRYADWQDVNPEQVQASYFAQKRYKGGAEIIDSVSGKTKEDEATYDLIMKDKERLLSFNEPVAFIFSHSALKEGWDNPNIFQICTLNQTKSEVKKRQEVGRGVRLAVDQFGDRIHDERVNVLTVVANESYENYVESLQSEVREDYGKEDLGPKPENALHRNVARLRKEYTLKPEFQALWERIRQKTRYAVKIDTEKLIDDIVTKINDASIKPPQITITKAEITVRQEDSYQALQLTAAKAAKNLAGSYSLPNLVEIMVNLMEHTTPRVRLTRRTLLEIFRRINDKQTAIDNPQEFAAVAVRIIKEKLADHLVYGIHYEKINDWYEMTQMESEVKSWEEYLVPAEHSVYDQVICDSDIEKKFVEDLERRDDVKLYLKLPSWFTVPTPVGTYNPDWAIVIEDRDEYGQLTDTSLLYLVRETKGTTNSDDLRPNERRKILCGEKHFRDALNVDYKVVTSAKELP